MKFVFLFIEIIRADNHLCDWSLNMNLACSATSVSASFLTPSSNDNCEDIFRNSDRHQYRAFLAKDVDDPTNEHCAIGDSSKSAEQSALSGRTSENIIGQKCYEWKEDTQEFVSNLFVTQIVNDNGIEKRIEVYPSMPVICKIVDFDVSTEFIVNDKETSGLIKESNTWDLAKLYLFTPAGSNPETQFDVGDEVVVIIDYGAKLDAKFGMRLKSCVYDGLNVITFDGSRARVADDFTSLFDLDDTDKPSGFNSQNTFIIFHFNAFKDNTDNADDSVGLLCTIQIYEQ